MTQYPRISKEGATLALRAVCKGPLCDLATRKKDSWSFVRIAHEFSELVRMARRHTGMEVAKCNRPWTNADERRQEKLRKAIRAKVKELFCWSPHLIEYGGDPRGDVTVKIWWGVPDASTSSHWPIG